MSRPRRFGKSLFLNTLKELFEGNQALFEGLHIHDRHDWSQRHPVVRLDFARGHFVEPGSLHANVHIGTEALLFQTGYLTITGEEKLGGMPLYRLGYPNRVVRQSLNLVLLRHWCSTPDSRCRTASAWSAPTSIAAAGSRST